MTQRPYYLRCDESQQHARFISGHLLEVVRFLFDPSGQVGEVVFDVLVEEYFDLIRLDALFLEDVKIVLLAGTLSGVRCLRVPSANLIHTLPSASVKPRW